MRHPMVVGGRWVCGEQHYVRTQRHAFVTYLHEARVVNTSLFDVVADPLEQRNLYVADQPAATPLAAWADLVSKERVFWPRDEVLCPNPNPAAALPPGEMLAPTLTLRPLTRAQR